MSAQKLIDALEQQYQIQAERKSIYDDIEALREYGLNVEQIPGRGGGYYVAHRLFEDVELQLLVNAVQASRFITDRKSSQLVRKLQQLASQHTARRLQHQLTVSSRVKSMNESIYYVISDINAAISDNVQITFRYFEYTVEKKKRYRHNSRLYRVSPYALLWNHENYYLIAYDSESNAIRHYRVDKMDHLDLTDAPRQGREVYDQLDTKAYTGRLFNMFHGRTEIVYLCLPNHLIGVVIDTFGQDVHIMPSDTEHFIARVSVDVSPQFFGWVFGLGPEAEITQSAHVRAEYQQLLLHSAEQNAPSAP